MVGASFEQNMTFLSRGWLKHEIQQSFLSESCREECREVIKHQVRVSGHNHLTFTLWIIRAFLLVLLVSLSALDVHCSQKVVHIHKDVTSTSKLIYYLLGVFHTVSKRR